MPAIFLCHASEDKPRVEPIQLALVGAGHRVFYDTQSLPPGGDYHQRILDAVAGCDLFVFIATRASVAPGKFTLSELKFARDRWPSPVNRVLPVVLDGLAPADLPPYLQAATVLQVHGNAAAEVVAAVARLAAMHRRRRAVRAIVGAGGLAAATALGGWAYTWLAPDPHGDDQPAPTPPAPRPAPVPMTGQLSLQSEPGDYIGDGRPHLLSSQNGIITATVDEGSVSIAFEGDDHWSADFAAPRGQKLAVGRFTDAQRTPFNNPLKPGLSVSGAGRGCNALAGEFTITQLEIGPGDKLRRLKLSFSQRCDEGKGLLTGTIDLAAP